MARKGLTWEDLANKINQMTPEEKKELVKVGGSELPICDFVILTKDSEDLCYDEEDFPCAVCDVRSNFDEGTNLGVALKANTYYLNAD